MPLVPDLITTSRLRQHLIAAALAAAAGVVVSLLLGWYLLAPFVTYGKYSRVFTDLVQSVNRFEADVMWGMADPGRPNADRTLKRSFRDAAELFALLRQKDKASQSGDAQRWTAIESNLGIDVEGLKKRYGIASAATPPSFVALWNRDDAKGESPEARIGEFILLGAQLVDTPNQASPDYKANTQTLLDTLRGRVWPVLHEAVRSVGNGTSAVARLAFYVVMLSAVLSFVAFVAVTFLILWPIMRSMLGTQTELLRERDRGVQAEQARHDFLAIISHELRTPLNSVLGFSNLLLSTPLNVKQRDYAETIQTAGQILLTLLNDVADIARIESGTLDLQKLDFSLEDISAEVLSLLGPQAATKRLDMSAYIDPNLPARVMGDAGRVRQVLLKLVANAVKYTERGGIAIEIKRYGGRDDGSHDIMFSVTDTGIGVPKNQMTGVFDHMGYMDPSTSRRNAGAGLGLPVCKKLVQLMDGEMGVESTLFKGSTFWFRIKLADVIPPAGHIRDNYRFDFTGRRILVVEHDTLSRSIFRFQLEAFNAEVDCVPDARAAINALIDSDRRGHTYDIAIIDHEAPDIDGIDLRKSIRECPEFRDVKLIISASEGIAYDQQARALGFDAASPKPIIQNKLVRQIQELLEQPARSVLGARNPQLPAIGEVSEQTPPTEEPPAKLPRLLIAEDNIINQRLVVATLTQAGYVVDAVGDGVEALQAMQKIPYDLILMDIRMPVMSGVDATRRIRALPGPAGKCPIIAMTANTLPGDREEYLAAGMNEYVPKPINFPDLLAKIKSYLDSSNTVEEAMSVIDSAVVLATGGEDDATQRQTKRP